MRAKPNYKYVYSLVIVHVMVRDNVGDMQLSRVDSLWTHLNCARDSEAAEVVAEDEDEW
jgi:hypothetical protein